MSQKLKRSQLEESERVLQTFQNCLSFFMTLLTAPVLIAAHSGEKILRFLSPLHAFALRDNFFYDSSLNLIYEKYKHTFNHITDYNQFKLSYERTLDPVKVFAFTIRSMDKPFLYELMSNPEKYPKTTLNLRLMLIDSYWNGFEFKYPEICNIKGNQNFKAWNTIAQNFYYNFAIEDVLNTMDKDELKIFLDDFFIWMDDDLLKEVVYRRFSKEIYDEYQIKLLKVKPDTNDYIQYDYFLENPVDLSEEVEGDIFDETKYPQYNKYHAENLGTTILPYSHREYAGEEHQLKTLSPKEVNHIVNGHLPGTLPLSKEDKEIVIYDKNNSYKKPRKSTNKVNPSTFKNLENNTNNKTLETIEDKLDIFPKNTQNNDSTNLKDTESTKKNNVIKFKKRG